MSAMRSPGAATIVVVGAGSAVFGVTFLQDLFQVPAVRGATLRLVDVNDVALQRMCRLAERLDEASGWGIRVEGHTRVEEALAGAGFVVVSVAVDRLSAWATDHELALRHGFPSVMSENAGPGGLSHTMRSIPLVLDIATAVERLAPGALLINYTNPANRVSLAISRCTTVRAVSLCHGVASTAEWAAGLLGVAFDDLDMEVAGVNHFNWIVSLTDRRTGLDLRPRFGIALAGLPEREWRLCRYVNDRLGSFPTTGDDHVGEFLPWAAELVGTAGYDFEGFQRHADALARRVEAWGTGRAPVEPLLAERSSEGRLDHSAATLIGDVLERRDGMRPSYILPNEALIADLPADAVVEVAGRLDAGVPVGRRVPMLPPAVRSLVAREVDVQALAVEAAVEGTRRLALEALLLDPVVTSARAAEAFLDDVLTVHRRLLPRFS